MGQERNTPLDCFADITWVGYCGRDVPAPVQEIFAFVTAGRDAAVHLVQERLAAGQTVYGYEVDDACRAVIAGAATARLSSTARVTAWVSRDTSTASTSTIWKHRTAAA